MNNWLKNNQMLNLDHLTTLIFKQNCLLCTAPTHTNLSLCAACIADFPPATWPCCPTCGISTSGEVCGKCMKQPPHFDETHALFTYTYPADAIINIINTVMLYTSAQPLQNYSSTSYKRILISLFQCLYMTSASKKGASINLWKS